jgi:hypothetical protein
MACTFVKLLAESPRNTCSKLLVDVVENWIKIMADTFPKTAAGYKMRRLILIGVGN